MTSVGVISSAVARIECLKELLKPPESFPSEAEQLRKGLEKIKETLIEAQGGKSREEEEKGIVRLSYEIVDAIVDASLKSKEAFFVSKLTHRKKSGNTKLQQLLKELNGFRDKLKNISSGSEGAGPVLRAESSSSTASEIQGDREDKPKKKTSVSFPKLHFTKKPEITKTTKLERKGSESIDPKKTTDSSEEKGDDEKMKPKGRDDLFKEITTDLKNRESKNSVVYIVGESGMGKTTFTRKLFHHLKDSFDVLAWVPINHDFQIKTVLRSLLQKLGPSQDQDIRDMNEMQLISHIFAALQKKNNNNLLVLDDIAALDDWESIRLALPVGNSTKVIVTTSSKDFLKKKNYYQISGLTQDKILDLLKEEASPITEKVGKAISDMSGGSPLFATILGKSLQQSKAEDDQLVNELRSFESDKGKPQVLGVCYKRLSHECKPCLLYLGQFPQGEDIDVEKLYLLLMAENLILSPKEESTTSLQTLEGYLKELADRKLVQVQEGTLSRGRTHKSCRLHDQVREFCKLKGSNEEFFEIVDLGSTSPKKIGLHTRRLAIYLSKYRADESNSQFESQETVQKIESIQFESKETVQKILSLLIFDTFESAAEKKSEWPSDMNDLKEFKNLRILNFDGVDFKVRKVPRGMDRLVLLRYLSFRGCWLEELPSSLSNLTQLETLDLVVHADCKMLIPNKILTNMKRMVHLYLPRLYESNRKTKLQLQGLESLEILINFHTEVCDFEALSQFKKLKTLSTISKGNTEDFDKIIMLITEKAEVWKLHYLSVDITSFDCYNRDSVSSLKKLLDCQFLHSIHIEGRIGKLPPDGPKSPAAEIFLDGSEIEDDPMNYLGTTFQSLQSLVLSNDAFLGSEIVISAPAAEFRNLRSLKLLNLQYLEKLTIKEGAMPKLSTLLIDSRRCLVELSIPKEMHDRLKKAEGEDEGVSFMVMPSPAKLIITTSDQVPSTSGSRD